MKEKILISEVGPRDGLQNCDGVMPTDVKKRWIQGLYDAGVREIEVGSFVPPKLFPQLADTAEVVSFGKTLSGLKVLALIPNLRGAQNALDAGVDAVTMPLSASETHSLRNMRQTHDQIIENVKKIRKLFNSAPKIHVRVLKEALVRLSVVRLKAMFPKPKFYLSGNVS